MLKQLRILVMPRVAAIALVGGAVVAAGCGQKGALYLPTSPAAAGRATLPEALLPSGAAPAAAPAAAASAPPASAPQR